MTNSRKATAVQPATESETAPQQNPQTPEPPTPDTSAIAIARCRAAHKLALDAYGKIHGLQTIDSYAAEKQARAAYRNAMPALSSRDNIRAFIACIADGVLFETILEKTSTRLLYAAQVALTGLPRESHHSTSVITTAKPSTQLITDH